MAHIPFVTGHSSNPRLTDRGLRFTFRIAYRDDRQGSVAADYMVRVVYADAADFERIHTDVLTQLPGVVRVQSTLALRTVKKTTALPV